MHRMSKAPTVTINRTFNGSLHNIIRPAARLAMAALFITAMVAVLGNPAALAAQEGSYAEQRVILLVVDRLSYPLLRSKSGPVLRSIISRSTVGLMNARAGSSTSESGYLSIGAGARAVSGPEGGQAYQREEKVDGVSAALGYLRNTGRLPAGQVCHLQVNILQGKNSLLSYPVTIGRLGQQLVDKGLVTAVFGNADHDFPNRSAVLIAMDQQGEVPLGQVGPDILKEDPIFPYGQRADIRKLSQRVAGALAGASLIVVEYGDFARLDQYWGRLSPSRQQDLLAQTMKELDLLLADLNTRVEGGTVLALVTPTPPTNLPGGGESLVPCLFLSSPARPGLLYSTSTRRLGLITNTDLAPVFISYLDGSVTAITAGPEITGYPHQDPLGYLDQFYNRSSLIYQQRPPLLKGYVLALIGSLLISLGGVLLGIPAVARLNWGFKFIMLVPLATLILSRWPEFPNRSVYLSGVLLAGFTGILLLALSPLKLKGNQIFWVALGLTTALAILLDTLGGSNLQQFSLLGYDPIAGARYYGLGNEYMGVLIGSTLLGSITMVRGVPAEKLVTPAAGGKSGKPAAVSVFLVYLLIIYLLSSPGFGANLGGTLTAAVAFGAAWSGLGVSQGRRADLVKTMGYFILIALLLLWVLNFQEQPGLPSHVGRLGAAVDRGGYAALWETIGRKLAMNWRLIRYSIWSRALVVLLGVMVVLCFYPVGVLKRLYRQQPEMLQISAAGGAGALAALLTNDSGVVAAALVLLYTVPPLWISVVNQTKTIRV